jgi:hypothetical protein
MRRVVAALQRIVVVAVVSQATVSIASATPINTNDINIYNQFATGAVVQDFESIVGITALGLNSYANALNSSTAVPTAAQLGLDIPGLLFHSGGGSFNNPTGNPGTPTAVLQLGGGIAGDAHSATNVVGSLEINTENLDLDNFIEVVFITGLQSRAGVWLNPSLGNVTFSAFDSTGTQLESFTGTAGNFVGVDRPNADIKFLSIVGGASGFTVDDLTYAGATAPPPPNAVPEPSVVSVLGLGLAGLMGLRRRMDR